MSNVNKLSKLKREHLAGITDGMYHALQGIPNAYARRDKRFTPSVYEDGYLYGYNYRPTDAQLERVKDNHEPATQPAQVP
jgi:hypothetical protein